MPPPSLFVVSLLAALAIGGCAGESAAPTAPKPAPSFGLKTLDGKTVSLCGYRGKVVLVDFWGTYCPPCMEAIPKLVQMRNRLHSAGLEIIGVACDLGPEGKAKVAQVIKKLKISYPIVRVDDKTAEEYAVDGLPALFLIDRQGNLVERLEGAVDHEALEARIRGLVEDGSWRSPTVRTSF